MTNIYILLYILTNQTFHGPTGRLRITQVTPPPSSSLRTCRVVTLFYDIPCFGRSFTTYPGWDAVLPHTRVGTHFTTYPGWDAFYDINGLGRSFTTPNLLAIIIMYDYSKTD